MGIGQQRKIGQGREFSAKDGQVSGRVGSGATRRKATDLVAANTPGFSVGA